MTKDGMTIAGGSVQFDERGLVPVVAQDEESGEVLMLAYASPEALRLTLETGRAHYYSRSRRELWRKGDSSGNVQLVSAVSLDCDGDAVVYRLSQQGPACHTGARSCFFRQARTLTEPGDRDAEPGSAATGVDEAFLPQEQAAGGAGSVSGLGEGSELGRGLLLLEQVVAQRLRELPEGSYVTRLHERGLGYEAQKVVEESGETVIAALERRDGELIEEAADLLFHLTVLLHERGQSLGAVAGILEDRHHRRRGGA